MSADDAFGYLKLFGLNLKRAWLLALGSE